MINIGFFQGLIGRRLYITGNNEVKGIFGITDFVNRLAARQAYQLHRIHEGCQLGRG